MAAEGKRPALTTPTANRRAPRLLDRVRIRLRTLHYSRRTEDAYASWIRRFILFHGKRHPNEMGEAEVTAFLSHLAVQERVSASTQNQALASLLFLYNEVLGRSLESFEAVIRAKRPQRLPVVLDHDEVWRILGGLEGPPRLVAGLLYGSGMRLLECLRLRVQDIDFALNQILIRDGKGQKDRRTLLPRTLKEPLQFHLERVREEREEDIRQGHQGVSLPMAIARKYPGAPLQWAWWYVFPGTVLSKDPRSGQVLRHHLHESVVQRAIKEAVRRAGIDKHATCHTLRHPSLPIWVRHGAASILV